MNNFSEFLRNDTILSEMSYDKLDFPTDNFNMEIARAQYNSLLLSQESLSQYKPRRPRRIYRKRKTKHSMRQDQILLYHRAKKYVQDNNHNYFPNTILFFMNYLNPTVADGVTKKQVAMKLRSDKRFEKNMSSK